MDHRSRLLALLVGAAGLWVLHPYEWTSGLQAMAGDRGDSRLVAWLADHVWQVSAGAASWRDPAYYFPLQGALAWCDAFVLHALGEAPFRLFGADALTAFAGSAVLHDALTYAAALGLARNGLRLSWAASTFAAALFAFSAAKVHQPEHAQLQPLQLLPAILWLGIAAMRAAQQQPSRRARSTVLLGLAAGLYGLQWFSGVYVAWFFGLWAALFALVGLALPALRARASAFVRGQPMAVALAGGILGAAGGLFAWSYLPGLRQVGWRTWETVQGGTAPPLGWLWPGRFNWAWGWLFARSPRFSALHWEFQVGLGLGVAVLVLLALAWLGVRVARNGFRHLDARTALALALLVSALGVYLLATDLGDGRSLWRGIYVVVPGGRSIRVPARHVVVSVLPLALGLGIALDAFRHRWRGRRWATLAVGLLAAIALVEQAGGRMRWDLAAERRYLHDLAATVPAGCEVVIGAPATPAVANYLVHLDAMWVARLHGLPTVNGYAGTWPDAWNPLWDTHAPDCAAVVARWLQNHGVAARTCTVFARPLDPGPDPP